LIKYEKDLLGVRCNKNRSKMRIEINLTEEVAKAIQEKAEAENHSRKSYIELLCINKVIKKSVKPKRSGSTDR
jgi:tRNA threonylcarbamoyladenosine modification (KEOPS) complex  Pcc1 subunit